MKSLRTAVRCIPLTMVLHKILFQLIQEVQGTDEIVLSNAFQSRPIQLTCLHSFSKSINSENLKVIIHAVLIA